MLAVAHVNQTDTHVVVELPFAPRTPYVLNINKKAYPQKSAFSWSDFLMCPTAKQKIEYVLFSFFVARRNFRHAFRAARSASGHVDFSLFKTTGAR